VEKGFGSDHIFLGFLLESGILLTVFLIKLVALTLILEVMCGYFYE